MVIAAVTVAWLRTGAELPPPAPTASHSRLTQAEGVERFPSVSPDGKWVLYNSQSDTYLQSVTGQTAINLTKDSPANDTTPAFSPDGETIAFRSERDGGGIFLMGRTGEAVRRLTKSGFQPAWSGGRLLVVDTMSGAGREVLAIPGEALAAPVPAADDSQLFFTHGATSGDIWLMRFGHK